MMKSLVALAFACGVAAAPLHVTESGFTSAADGKPAGWSTWSARSETAPRCYIDTNHFRAQSGSLAISGNNNIAEHGGWERVIDGVEPGGWYRFTAYYQAEDALYESLQVVARLDWRDAASKRAGQPDYVYNTHREGAWTRVTLDTQAPEKASAVAMQLYLYNAPQATVRWDDISLEQIPAPKPRKITIASVNLRPVKTGSTQESLRQFLDTIEKRVPAKTDVILLPEGITVVGTDKSYADVAEPIPGPTTARLGEVAKRHNAWVAAGIYEREGHVIYNTAILIDRSGNLAGKYRKVYLPREEIEHGLTPGSEYPVFHTDFGTVGLMICYDSFFADPARALATQGAEVLLMPIWGGDEALVKARAIENKVFVVASGYDFPTYVMDPNGEVLSKAQQNGSVAISDVDLNRRYLDKWLGDMHGRRMKEIRLDVKQPVPGFFNQADETSR